MKLIEFEDIWTKEIYMNAEVHRKINQSFPNKLVNVWELERTLSRIHNETT